MTGLRSIATASMGDSLERRLESAKLAGFDAVEVRALDLVTCFKTPEQLARLAQGLGVRIDAYQPLVLPAVDPDVEGVLRRARHALGVMNRLGARTLVVHTAPVTGEGATPALPPTVLAVADEAAGLGVRLALRPPAGAAGDVLDLARAVAQASHPAVGVCLDSGLTSAEVVDQVLREVPHEALFHVQLSGAPLFEADRGGAPHVDAERALVAFLEAVVRHGYDGLLTVESVNEQDQARDAFHGAMDAMRLLLTIEGAVAAAVDGAPGAATERLVSLPAAAPLLGLAFAELDVDAASAGVAGMFLRNLGLELAGQHRTKAVSLWSRGEAHVLLNSSGRGRSRHEPVEAVVSALGVRTSDPGAAAERATFLHADVADRVRGPGEADLPQLAVPGGVEVLFCPPAGSSDDWLADFDPVPAGRPGTSTVDLGIEGIDHVALPVEPELFDEAVLFLRSVLGLRAQDVVSLQAPTLVSRSRALCTTDRGVRLALNARRTPGPGQAPAPQHIAFRCRDVVAAARAIGSTSLVRLPVPDNYYDDLSARTGMDAARVAELREAGVMYDRDDEGEFLHLYTSLVGRSLFFELVQRVDGYDGYASVNTAVRSAAHRRWGS